MGGRAKPRAWRAARSPSPATTSWSRWGPSDVGAKPAKPDERQAAALEALVRRHSTTCSRRCGRARSCPSTIASAHRGRRGWPVRRTEGDTRALRPYPSGDHRSPGRTRCRSRAGPARVPSRPAPSDDVSDLDKRIIEHLQADGRRPFTQIAAELGVSEAAVRARTNRLIERGILQIVGVTDPLKLGFHQMAMIGIRCESDQLVTGRRPDRRDARGRLRRHHRRHVRPARSRPSARTTRPCCGS